MKRPAIPVSVQGFGFVAFFIIATALVLSIVFSTTPSKASEGALVTFFLSLCASLTGSLGMIWHLIRKYTLFKLNAHPKFWVSVRQAFLLSALTCLSFFLHTLNLFQVWDIFPLLLAFILVEFFFQAEKTPHASISL